MKRPETFGDIKGHDWLVTYLEGQIQKGTLHHFLILEGAEGIGKTSLADLIALSLVYGLDRSEARTQAYNSIVVNGESNDNIKRFACSVDGGKDVARLIKDEMNTTFTVSGPKVIICDECHGLTAQAQDVFLSETEFISDKVYIIMLTTEIEKLKASLRSRAVPLHLHPLKQADMIKVLKAEVEERKLHLQNENAILSMIAEWSECKPRTGLNILNAFSNGTTISSNEIRELIGYIDVKDILPILSSLSGSMTFGLSSIMEMNINNSIINIVLECISIKSGNKSYKLKMSDMLLVREQLQNVTTEQLIEFLYGITKHQTLTRTDIINAYISAHQSRNLVTKENTRDVLDVENTQRANVEMQENNEGLEKAPTLGDLFKNSSIIN